MIRRLAWIALWTLVAAVAIGAQLDRQTRRNPELARFVPAPLRGYAQWEVTADTLESGDAAPALKQARELVRRRPMPAENLMILAQAHQALGDDGQTLRTILAAGGRGWRAVPIQEAVLRLALGAGEDAEAGRRLAALWAVGHDQATLAALSRLVLARPEGIATFAGQLAGTRRWQDSFLRQAAGSLAPGPLARTVSAAIARGADFDCQTLSDTARALAERGNAGAALEVWTGRCVAASTADGKRLPAFAFSADNGAPAGPFDWHYPQAGPVTRAVRQGAAGAVMDFDNTALVTQPLASRLAMLAPGRHVLILSAQSPAAQVLSEASCINAGGRRRTLANRQGIGELAFDVPAAGCAVQRIDLRAAPGAVTGLRLEPRPQ